MGITPETKIHDLIEQHPYLLDFLVGYNAAYEKLRNPVLYNTVGRFATLRAAAEMGDVTVEALIGAIEREVALRRIHSGPTVGAASSPDAETGDQAAPHDRAGRQEKLKAIIRSLHLGASIDEVKADFDMLLQEVDAAEIAAMEQALITEGMAVEEVQRLCDVHVAVFKESLESGAPKTVLPPGHPVDSYRRENEHAARVVGALRCTLDEASALQPAELDPVLEALSAGLADLLDGVTTHYTRKENQLFPLLEAHGIEGPTKVMWGIDDDIRARLKVALTAAQTGDAASLTASLPETLTMVEDMIYKEERILFPTALDALSDGEWDVMAAGEGEIGFAWIDAPKVASDTAVPESAAGTAAEHLLPLTTGALSLAQLDLMLRALPVDVTFVDETGRVRYYSEGERVFPRSPAVIGREVRNCHPPKSVAVVERIVEEFRAGTKDIAEFWIELGERIVHIRYFALRDPDNTYRGVLEVSQDVTAIRSLEGQRRLLDWDT